MIIIALVNVSLLPQEFVDELNFFVDKNSFGRLYFNQYFAYLTGAEHFSRKDACVKSKNKSCFIITPKNIRQGLVFSV